MSDISVFHRSFASGIAHRLGRPDRVWLVVAGIFAALAVVAPGQATASAGFTLGNLADIAPYLLVSVAFAAWATASGADSLIARAFSGPPLLMIAMGALA